MSSELMKRLLAEARAKKEQLVSSVITAPVVAPTLEPIEPVEIEIPATTIPINTTNPAAKLAELRAKLARVPTNEITQTILPNKEEASLPKEAEGIRAGEMQDNKGAKEEVTTLSMRSLNFRANV